MEDHIGYGLVHATEDIQRRTAEEIVDTAFQSVRPKLVDAVQTFLANPISPIMFFTFEIALVGLTREIGRRLVELAINGLERKTRYNFLTIGGFSRAATGGAIGKPEGQQWPRSSGQSFCGGVDTGAGKWPMERFSHWRCFWV